MELVFGEARLRNATDFCQEVKDDQLRDHLGKLLAMYRELGRDGRPGRPLQGIGVLESSGGGLHVPTRAEYRQLSDLQAGLFLAMVAQNVRLGGPNSGSQMWTADNVGIVSQRFTVGSERTAESAGVIVERTIGGYRVDAMQYTTPSYVPSPISFRIDERLFHSLDQLRTIDAQVFRRVLDAADLVRVSYFNSHIVDLKARLLLLAAAFERLLELPERDQRKVFKAKLEESFATVRDRRFRYFSPRRGGQFEAEVGSVFRFWGDQFYSLRSKIIHGESVAESSMMFRSTQGHHAAAVTMFVGLATRAVARAFHDHSGPSPVAATVRWMKPSVRDDPEEHARFKLVDDYWSLLESHHLREASPGGA